MSESALRLMPIETSAAQALIEQAQAALMARHLEPAKALLVDALRAEPGNPLALMKLGEIALLERDPIGAHRHLTAALQTEPNFAPAWAELAHALWLAGRRHAAVVAAARALEVQPFNGRFRLRFVQFAAWTGRTRQATEALAPLLDPAATDPVLLAAAIGMQGEILVAAGRFRAAMPYLEDAIRRLPTLAAARVILYMNRLRLGDFPGGWEGLDIREPGREVYPNGPPPAYGVAWDGGDLTGRTLLVADDQGHGDAIQFFRYLPMIRAARPAHITWRTFPPLVRLFAAAAPDITVLAGLPGHSRFDANCTSTRLPRLLDATASSIPGPVPYLHAPAAGQSRIARPDGDSLKVGLVWSGDVRHVRDHLRSIPAADFLRLADIPGIAFYSLQRDVRPADLAALEARPGIDRRVERTVDLADTAALIDGLDLVVAVDTGVAHLAAAMGKPVWILLHCAPDWRWQAERTDSPWYPTVRLFRLAPEEWVDRDIRGVRLPASLPSTDKADDMGWQPLLRRVARALRDVTKRRGA